MQVGEYVKYLRESRGLTQEELGKVIGVQRAAVQKWESGKVQNLKRETIKKLSEYFGVPASSFIDSNVQTSIDKEFAQILSEMTEEDKVWLLNIIKSVIDGRKK